jgi:hypothetical protein
LLAVATPVVADVKTGNFNVQYGGRGYIEGSPDLPQWNVLLPSGSGGDGYREGTNPQPWFWYAVPGAQQQDPWGNLNPEPGWHNQWWYDDPFDPTRWKVVSTSFLYARTDPNMGIGWADVWFNYSKPGWSPNPDKPPTPALDIPPGTFIGRVQAAHFQVGNDAPQLYTGTFNLKDLGVPYNPEWVSIDVTGYNFLLANGVFQHECVPEPATASLLVLGAAALGLLALFRRRRA